MFPISCIINASLPCAFLLVGSPCIHDLRGAVLFLDKRQEALISTESDKARKALFQTSKMTFVSLGQLFICCGKIYQALMRKLKPELLL